MKYLIMHFVPESVKKRKNLIKLFGCMLHAGSYIFTGQEFADCHGRLLVNALSFLFV